MIDKNKSRTITFQLGNMFFEYDEWKNEYNLEHHGISFRNAARVFFDYDRIELYDEQNSAAEDRFNTIGNLEAGMTALSPSNDTTIGNINAFLGEVTDILFVVYTERIQTNQHGEKIDVTRLISARQATNFERGLYYGKYQ